MKLVTIIPPEYDGKGIARSQGTKVLTEDGEVHGIKSIKINLGTDDAITADIELLLTFSEIRGVSPRYMMRHPRTNKQEEISAIQFASGEILSLHFPQKIIKEKDITNLSSKSREFAR